MFDEVTAKRLDRFERETSRRKWDSAVMTASQRRELEQAGVVAPAPAAGSPEISLVDLLAERFDRLERANHRLEWQIGQIEQGGRRWKWAIVAALASVGGMLAYESYDAVGRVPIAVQAAKAGGAPGKAPGPQLGAGQAKGTTAWITP